MRFVGGVFGRGRYDAASAMPPQIYVVSTLNKNKNKNKIKKYYLVLPVT
jgi:hypothetical protein